MSLDIDNLIKNLSSLSVIELSDLSKRLEEEWGVSASSFASKSDNSKSSSESPQQIKDKFEVVLVSSGDNKINVIKEVRSITGLGLKEAKDFVESAPKTLKTDVEKSESEEIKKKLEAVGAKVELK